MVFSKTFLVLLLAILGTSWIPDGRTNGLASACWSRATPPVRCEQENDPKVATAEIPTEVLTGVTKQVPSIDDIPQEYDEFAPLTIGLWIENKYYQLPNARYYKVEFKEGTSRSLTHVPNPFYHGGPVIIKD